MNSRIVDLTNNPSLSFLEEEGLQIPNPGDFVQPGWMEDLKEIIA